MVHTYKKESCCVHADVTDSMNDEMKWIWNSSKESLPVIGRQTIKSKKWRFFGGWPSLYRGRTPTGPGLGLNNVPHASQYSGRQSCHCAIESGLLNLSTFPFSRCSIGLPHEPNPADWGNIHTEWQCNGGCNCVQYGQLIHSVPASEQDAGMEGQIYQVLGSHGSTVGRTRTYIYNTCLRYS